MIRNRHEFCDVADLNDYLRLIEQAGRFASLAGFVLVGSGSGYSSLAHAVIHEVTPYLVGVETGLDSWPGTTMFTQSDASRYVFDLNPETSEILTRNARSLFDWHNPRLPEDLHFMRPDNSLVLGAVAHEDYAWLELSPDELALWIAEGKFPVEVAKETS